MSADLPSGKVPTTRVLRLISLFRRSIALFARVHRQCSHGILQYASVSAHPSRTTLAADASRGSIAWMALSMAAAWERLGLGTLARTLR